MSVKVIITHYKEDFEWINNIKYDYLVFKKNTKNYNERFNKASIFFRYIIDNYDNLTDYTVFINGHKIDNKKVQIDITINSLKFDRYYRNIFEETPISNNYMDFSCKKMDIIMSDIESILNKKINVSQIESIYSPHFYVHKDNIRFSKKETYQQLYDYLEKTNESPYWTEKIFEYVGHFIFTDLIQLERMKENMEEEPKYETKEKVIEKPEKVIEKVIEKPEKVIEKPEKVMEIPKNMDKNLKMLVISNKTLKNVKFKNLIFPHEFNLNRKNILKSPFMVFDNI